MFCNILSADPAPPACTFFVPPTQYRNQKITPNHIFLPKFLHIPKNLRNFARVFGMVFVHVWGPH